MHQRTSAANAGFGTGTPWLPLGRGHRELAVDGQDADPDSTLATHGYNPGTGTLQPYGYCIAACSTA